MLGPPASAMGEVMQYLVESATLSPIEIRNLQEYVIRPRLRTIPGVADINSWGGMVQQFQVLDLWFTPAIRLQESIDGPLRFRLWRTHHGKDCVLYVGKIFWI